MLNLLRKMREHFVANMDTAHEWATSARDSNGVPCLLGYCYWSVGPQSFRFIREGLSELLKGEFLSISGGTMILVPLFKTVEGRQELLERIDRKIAELEEFEFSPEEQVSYIVKQLEQHNYPELVAK